jgi:hypothetical protein
MIERAAAAMPERYRRQRVVKRTFAPIPARALSDRRLSARHFRVLGGVALHDRFGKNGQGCWAGRKRLAQASSCSETHVSDALSDLRRWGYVKSEPHPMNRRTTVHRVIYDEEDGSQIRDLSGKNRSRFLSKQVPPQNLKPLKGLGNEVSNILSRNLIKNCAEALPSGQGVDASIDDAKQYLCRVEMSLSDSDEIIRQSVRCERAALSLIAENENLPRDLRDRAASLRNIADNTS